MPDTDGRGAAAGAPAVERTAGEIMTASPRTCSPFSTITEAALIFVDHNCGVVPVLDGGKPVGILTDRDVALAASRYDDLPARPVSDVMTRDVVTVPADAPLSGVEAAFGEHKVRRLLVVDAAGLLVGIIAWSDLVPHIPAGEVGRVVADVVDRPRATGATAPRPVGQGAGRAGEGGPVVPGPWYMPGALWGLAKQAAGAWSEDKAPRLGAALAFYSVLSLAPLLVIAIAIAGLVFGRDAARGYLMTQIQGMVGKEGGGAVEAMLANTQKPGAGAVAAVLGVLTLVAGATGVVGQLQDAMNTIWEVAPKPGRGVVGFLKSRFLSLGMVLGVGFLLLVSLLLSTATTALGSFFGGLVSRNAPVLEAANFAVSLVVVTLLFAMIYKLLPDAEIAWRDVWVGAVLTALLFVVGKTAIGLYLGKSGIGSTYGAAGSLVVLLVWVYYSAQILFFGAEFTKAYADQFGSQIVPSKDAVPVTDEARAQQGMPRPETLAAGSKRPPRA